MKPEDYTHEDISSRWTDFFETDDMRPYVLTVQDLGEALVVSFDVLERFDSDFASALLLRPDKFLKTAGGVLKGMTGQDSPVRIHDLPNDAVKYIRCLRSEDIGTMVSIRGLVKRASEVRSKLMVGVFKCSRCPAEMTILQSVDAEEVEMPMECDKDQQGCGRTAAATSFKLVPEKSTFADTQELDIQDSPEGLSGGTQPERIKCILDGGLAMDRVRVNAGDRVMVTGVVRVAQAKKNSAIFIPLMIVNHIEFIEHDFAEITIDEETIKKIQEAALEKNIVRKLSQNIAASVYGYEVEKIALMLQQFSGQTVELLDGTRTRGDIHIFLVGDPGVAKTQILLAQAALSPRAVMATGGASSGVGLTAAAVKDDATGRWVLEAGAAVLADGGMFILDEADKMDKKDLAHMHEGMESQTITVTKAGINTTLQARFVLLAAANPKYGRFDVNEPLAAQVDLPPPILSRFDLIFALRDKVDKTKDKTIAKHIGKRREGKVGSKKFSADFIRQYVAYARQHITHVNISDELHDMIADIYSDKRSKSSGGAIAITPRQVEGIYRLAEASARCRLHDYMDEEDVNLAVQVVEHFLKNMAMEDGKGDIDMVMTITSSSSRNLIASIKKILASDGPSDFEHLKGVLNGTPEEKIRKAIDDMKKGGELLYNKGLYSYIPD